jgi:GNAT superfamily N-acetyltransferase
VDDSGPLFPDADERLLRWLVEGERQRAVVGYVADDEEGRLAGFIVAHQARWEFDPPIRSGTRVVVVDAIAVEPRARRQGVGRLLADRLIEHARISGAVSIEVDVESPDPAAARFWASSGFHTRRQSARLVINPREPESPDVSEGR